jgi:NADH:ubiquinone oxidoreductase subunit E
MDIKIEICMGSSCFARGNSKILSALEKYKEEKKETVNMEIIGHLCMNNCSRGPIVKINDLEYLNKSGEQIIEILNSQEV